MSSVLLRSARGVEYSRLLSDVAISVPSLLIKAFVYQFRFMKMSVFEMVNVMRLCKRLNFAKASQSVSILWRYSFSLLRKVLTLIPRISAA